MDYTERKTMWHRLASEANLYIGEYYNAISDISFEMQMRNYQKYGHYINDRHEDIMRMHDELIRFSESNPLTIEEATGELKELLILTLPGFLAKYPQYKGTECLYTGE